MNLTSISFWILVIIAVICYYVIPLKYRWIAIFFTSIFYIIHENRYELTAVMLFMTGCTYITAVFIEKHRDKIKTIRSLLVVCILINAGTLIVLKDINFFMITGRCIQRFMGYEVTLHNISVLAPIGISYYTLTLIGYVLDVYWGTEHAEMNPLKFILFVGYFPLLISGPIIRSSESKNNILDGHKFCFRNICFGLQRIFWGLFKKLVISERLAILVNSVYADFDTYSGLYVWIAVIAFAFQLYSDFSGCIDIVLGVSELFGITLPENFNLPFLSRNLSEFWRRWHITLGGWLRDYILYPILKTSLWQKLGESIKKKFGKKLGKKIPVWCGMLISWFLIGFWHGGAWNYIIGVGIFFGSVITLGEMLEPFFKYVILRLGIQTETFSWRLFQAVRTFSIFVFGLSFFRSYNGVREGICLWKSAFSVWNPWILVNGSLTKLGLDAKDLGVLCVSMVVLMISGLLKYYLKKPVRLWLWEQNLVFRWIMLYLLLFGVIIFGLYGSDYDAAAFIYQQF